MAYSALRLRTLALRSAIRGRRTDPALPRVLARELREWRRLRGSFRVAGMQSQVVRVDRGLVTQQQEDFGREQLVQGLGVTEGTEIQINITWSEEGVACCIVKPGINHLFKIDFTSYSDPCTCSEDSRVFGNEYFEGGKLRVREVHRVRKPGPVAGTWEVSLMEDTDAFHLEGEGEGDLVWGGSREWKLEGVDLRVNFTIRANRQARYGFSVMKRKICSRVGILFRNRI
jgi:hypothetical protein